MVCSVFDLFKIGVGPSSSHTMGPMTAACRFVEGLREAGLLERVAKVGVDLYGSLALTGKGHATDRAILLGLSGQRPDRIDPDEADRIVAGIRETGRLPLGGKREIGFDEARGAVRTFKIERILSVEPTTRTFEAPEVGVVEQAGRAWDIIADQAEVEVVLRFGPAVASRVAEATWHPSQRLEPEGDGSLVWRAIVPGTVEIRFWILSFMLALLALMTLKLR